RMDWPVTARTTIPHVRQTVADRELETWLAVDLSASLDFGTARHAKRELAVAAAAAMSHLTVRGGNRVGAVIGTGDQLTRLPARTGARGLRRDGVRRSGDRPAARGTHRGRQAARAVRRRRGRPALGDRPCDPRCRGGPPAPAYRPGLAARHRAFRRRPAARAHQGDHTMIRFLEPVWLLASVPVPALAGVYA